MSKITPSVYGDSDFTRVVPANAEQLARQIHDNVAEAMGIPAALLTTISGVEYENVQKAQNNAAEQAITTDLVFDMFCSIYPGSPWTARLRKVQALFNLMGESIAEAMENEAVVTVLASSAPAQGIAYAHAVSKLHEAYAALSPVRTDTDEVA